MKSDGNKHKSVRWDDQDVTGDHLREPQTAGGGCRHRPAFYPSWLWTARWPEAWPPRWRSAGSFPAWTLRQTHWTQIKNQLCRQTRSLTGRAEQKPSTCLQEADVASQGFADPVGSFRLHQRRQRRVGFIFIQRYGDLKGAKDAV